MTETKTLNDLGSNAELAACPCGRPIDELQITDAAQGGKWANVSGNCCGEWMIEFRTNYEKLTSEKCMALAIAAWNKAPRAATWKSGTDAALSRQSRWIVGLGITFGGNMGIRKWFSQLLCKHSFECISGSGSTYRCRKCGKIEGIFG